MNGSAAGALSSLAFPIHLHHEEVKVSRATFGRVAREDTAAIGRRPDGVAQTLASRRSENVSRPLKVTVPICLD